MSMTDNDIFQRIKSIFVEEFELEPEQLVPEATLFDDLGLDSLDAVDLVVAMEKAFEVKLANEEKVKAVRTVNDLFELIISLQDSKADN